MPTYPNEMDLILVALMPKPKDFEIARMLGWYRIPLKSAPKVISVDYLAFYQPNSFGDEHRWKIEYISKMEGHELTTRAALFKDESDHPRAHEEYFKIQLGNLIKLPRPIEADRWRRITFLYTTGGLLSRAETIRDMVVDGEERDVLWKALKERAANFAANQPKAQDYSGFDIDFLSFFAEWDKIKELNENKVTQYGGGS